MAQIKPQTYKLPGKKEQYFLAEDLKIFNPDFFAGTSKGIRKIIERKSIPESEIVFANELKNEWNICTSASKKAKLFISKPWTDNNFFKRNTKEIIPKKDVQKIIDEDSLVSEQNEIDEEIIEEAPNIIDLDNEEKFKDSNGNIIEIETRGERDRKNIFFKVKDISIGFEMPSLAKNLTDKNTSFENNLHYKFFSIRKKSHTMGAYTIKKAIYLTYKGLLRVLFVSRNKNAESFQDWAEDKLFTIQMGSDDKKEELGCEIMSLDVKSYRAVFKSHATDFPCIYLLRLGSVKDLRSTFNIDLSISDNLIVYKYGNSDNMERRMSEHGRDYGKMKNVRLEMTIYHVIDTKYLFDAETDLRQFFKNFRKSIEVDGRSELVALDDDGFKQTKNLYRMIGSDYAGATFGLQKKITRLEMEIKEIQHGHEIELMKKEMEIQKGVMIIQQKDLEIEKKNLELEKRDLMIQIRDMQLDKYSR